MTAHTHITIADLGDACPEQVKLFRETFGDKAKINLRNMTRAMRVWLDVFWLWRLMPAPALAECEKAMDLAWAKFLQQRPGAAALAKYNKARAAALVAALTGGAS